MSHLSLVDGAVLIAFLCFGYKVLKALLERL